jgi:hypothetical protein
MSFENIKLEKGMYGVAGKTFSEVLESIDPSDNYKETALDGLDAFGRQLKRFGIRVNGKSSDVVEKFFATTDSAALFPEYVSRTVNQGITEAGILDNILASKTVIDSLDYRSIRTMLLDPDELLSEVAQGEEIPTVTIEPATHLIQLKKHGLMLETSYEAIRFQKLDVLAVTLKQIGQNIARTQLDDAINTIIFGDGNGNASNPNGNSLSYAELIENLMAMFSTFAFDPNTVIASPNALASLLMNPDVRSLIGVGAEASVNKEGIPTKLFGANLFKTSILPSGVIVLDKSCALEMVTAGDVSLETDRLIDRQLSRTAITTTYGFAKLFDDASVVCEISE